MALSPPDPSPSNSFNQVKWSNTRANGESQGGAAAYPSPMNSSSKDAPRNNASKHLDDESDAENGGYYGSYRQDINEGTPLLHDTTNKRASYTPNKRRKRSNGSSSRERPQTSSSTEDGGDADAENGLLSSTTLDAEPASERESPSDARSRPRTIRFFSRVRITSGVGRTSPHHRRKDHTPHTPLSPENNNRLSRESSISASSSISAPLRASTDTAPRVLPSMQRKKIRPSLTEVLDTSSTNQWLQQLADAKKQKRIARRARNTPNNPYPLSPTNDTHENVEPDANDRKTVDDVVYGRWPWRLFNLYYWESRVASICCEESDYEE